MTGKTWILIGVLLFLGGLLLEPAPAAARQATNPVQAFSRVDLATVRPLQSAAPTSQPVASDETSAPIASEAGRDYGLIIGAVILVLIVVGGMIFSTRHKSTLKARD